MGAQDDLAMLFVAHANMDRYTATVIVDAALKRHAHELAGKIRAGLEVCDAPNGSGDCCGITQAADLIDPKVPE